MPRSHKPRKRFDPRRHPVDRDPIELAMNQIATLQPSQRATLKKTAEDAFDAFRRGHGSAELWAHLADALNMGEAMATLNLANDHGHKFTDAQIALGRVHQRHAAGGNYTLRGDEIAALDDALFIYGVQLDVCSKGEWLAAIDRVSNRVRSACAGNAAPGTQVLKAPAAPLASLGAAGARP